MADKKVDRYRRGSLTPSQKMRASNSDEGTVNMADPTHDKGKSALVDKFRQREERWRSEQARHDQEAVQAAAQEAAHAAAQEAQLGRHPEVKPGEPMETDSPGEGGAR